MLLLHENDALPNVLEICKPMLVYMEHHGQNGRKANSWHHLTTRKATRAFARLDATISNVTF